MGFAWMPSCAQVRTSLSSSRVPNPPGNTTKAVADRAIDAATSA